MYEHIEKDIENKECKEIFENECKQGMEELGRTIKGLVKKCEEQFRKDIQKDVGQFGDRIENFSERFNRINIDHDSNINPDNGIKEVGLLASIISLTYGIPNFWNFSGWISIGLGLVGIVKSVWSWFSSDYKKSQQKKEVDKSLDKVCGRIEEKMRNQIEDAKKIISENVEGLKAGLNDPVVCCERMREGLIKAGEDLWHLSNNIKTRIVQ
ncbi:apolipoL family protein [Helicobacter pylori]|uniref:apolipoL family protein n=1 Tax=Helicobacter pylori TaxID=210 RepID=UPI00353118E4